MYIDNADLQLRHILELVEDEINDGDEFQRHKMVVVGAVIFQGAEELRANASHADKQEKHAASFEIQCLASSALSPK
jgi:hypothetical protein